MTDPESISMKIDMSRDAVTLRLNQVAELRRICLSLAGSRKGFEIQRNKPENEIVQRTSLALGRISEPTAMNGDH
jgi:hypothetical protein